MGKKNISIDNPEQNVWHKKKLSKTRQKQKFFFLILLFLESIFY